MMKKFDKVQDSGKRQNFSTGSVRDTDEGKGKPHLVGGEAIAKTMKYLRSVQSTGQTMHREMSLVQYLNQYTELVEDREQNINLIYLSIDILCKLMVARDGITYYEAYRLLAVHYENGAKKYSAHNWRLGQPISRYYDSAMRHVYKYLDGHDDEDHASALFWNLVGIIQTKIDIQKGLLPKELDDFPILINEVFKDKESISQDKGVIANDGVDATVKNRFKKGDEITIIKKGIIDGEIIDYTEPLSMNQYYVVCAVEEENGFISVCQDGEQLFHPDHAEIYTEIKANDTVVNDFEIEVGDEVKLVKRGAISWESQDWTYQLEYDKTYKVNAVDYGEYKSISVNLEDGRMSYSFHPDHVKKVN